MSKDEMRAMLSTVAGSVPVKRVETGVVTIDPTSWRMVHKYGADLRTVSDDRSEQLAERRRELAFDAFKSGDKDFGFDVMSGRYDDTIF